MATDATLVPDAPAVGGLHFRGILGQEDAIALYEVHAGRAARDGVDPCSTLEDWQSGDDLAMSLSQAMADGEQGQWLVAQVDDRVIGYSQIECWFEDDGTWVYLITGWILPEWRSRGVGTAMLRWGESTARRLAGKQHPGEHSEFAANASSTETDTTALLVHEGYRAMYTVLEMGLDISVPLSMSPVPAGIEVRPVLSAHCSLIAVSIDESYRNEYDASRFQEAFDPVDYATRLGGPRHDPTLWQVAWDGDQVVGQVLSVIENGRAEVFEVSVRPAWRQRGLARALLSRALRSLRERGVDIIRLHTVAEFRTRASELYGSVGFRILKEFRRYRKPLV